MSQAKLIEDLQLIMDLLWFFESKLMQGLVDSYLLAVQGDKPAQEFTLLVQFVTMH